MIGVRDGDDPVARRQTHGDPRRDSRSGGRPGGRSATPSTACRASRPARTGTSVATRGPRRIIRYQHVPHDGGNRFQMQDSLDAEGLGHLVPRCWRNKPTGTTDVFGRLYWKRPAFTIRTEFYKPEKGRYLHPSEDRPITIREAARCMSFPDDFVFPADQKWTEIAKQIGNAVPPGLAYAIARHCRPTPGHARSGQARSCCMKTAYVGAASHSGRLKIPVSNAVNAASFSTNHVTPSAGGQIHKRIAAQNASDEVRDPKELHARGRRSSRSLARSRNPTAAAPANRPVEVPC